MKYNFITKDEVLNIINNLPHGNEKQETIKYYLTEYCKDSFKTTELRKELEKRKLYEFEIQQLLSFKPKSLLCLQLVIDEMEERFSIEELNEILNLYKNIN